MKKTLKIFFVLFFCFNLFFPPLPASAQANGDTIPASGQLCAQGICNNISITFPPNGGAVSGTLSGQGNKDGCSFQNNGVLNGTFAGGDGGAVNGTVSWTMTASCAGNSISDTWSGTWQGAFYANGSGSGSGVVQSATGNWTVSFSADEFARITTPITKEYFKTTYGIDVVDGTSQWTEHQLRLLDDLIKKLPKSYWDKTKFTQIVRNKAYIDPKTKNENLDYYGCYSHWDRTIQVFDHASDPSTFADDPNGDKEFIGTIVHEMTHAFHFYKDYKSVYETTWENATNPVMKDFTLTTRDNLDDFRTGWVWKPTEKKFEFKGVGEENVPMTNYAKTVNPMEDLCEAVMFYVVEPESIAAKSPNRYEFIKDKIFGGVEYAWDY